jgi:hypothetical protein
MVIPSPPATESLSVGARSVSYPWALSAMRSLGALTFVQRADSALQLNVRFHTLALDGPARRTNRPTSS